MTKTFKEWCEENNPQLLEEWDSAKNGELSPDSISYASHKKVWWKGKCGHEWESRIANRIYEGAGCTICAGKVILAGFNDLATARPDLMLDWDYSKNAVDPTTIAKSSKQKCYWKCHLCGHEWKASPRVRRDSPCSVCSSVKRISLPEKSIAYYLKKAISIEENYVPEFLGKQELDIYIPQLRIGIEYDGSQFHTNAERDRRKNRLCRENDVKLIRIRADSLPEIDDCIVIPIEEKSDSELDEAIKALFRTINDLSGTDFNIDVDVNRDSNQIREARYSYYVENSFARNHPECLPEVHPTKNGNINLEMVSEFSVQRMHWICSKGHEWTSTISNRASGHGCPYCAGVKVCPGENDLQTLRKDLAAEWHPTRNGDLTPKNVAIHSNKKAWWRCKNGHEWQAVVHVRAIGLCDCPYCKNRYLDKGENDLFTKRPDIAKEWHPTRNGDLTPSDVRFNQDTKVWWRCDKGHEWEAVVGSRTYDGRGCPYCSGRFAISGETDLQTIDRELCMDWHPTKNGDLKPYMVSPGSDRKVWWKGKCGHEWESSIYNYRKSRNCPYCTNTRVLPGFNDLATKDPELSKEWHPTRNGGLKPSDVLPHSNRKVWWKGKCGHEWEAVISSRYSNRRGCPYCAGQKVLPGFNDLASNHQDLAKQWNYQHNAKGPDEYTCHSGMKVWWICDKGHEWQAFISNRVKGQGCPVCAGRKPKQ